MNRKLSFRFVAAIGVFLTLLVSTTAALGEVVVTEKDLLFRGGRQLGASEIEKVFVGKTVITRIISGDHRGKVREHVFNRDGTFRSRNTWDERQDGTTYDISEEALLCRRYGSWFKASVICRKIYSLGDHYYWVGRDGRVECVVLEIK